MITLPENFVTGILTNSGLLFDDFKPLFLLAIAICIGLWIAGDIVNFYRNKKEPEIKEN